MKAARTRIGRVTMKNGGADVRVVHREPESHIATHLRSWVRSVVTRERPPDAYAAVALWFSPEAPGRPGYNATFCTTHDAIPAPVLVQMAGPYLVAEHAAYIGECRAIEAMGGEIDDWRPDDAS